MVEQWIRVTVNVNVTYFGRETLVKKVSSFKNVFIKIKALTGLDRESAHLLQLHAVKRSCCTAANLGATGQLSP